MLDPFDEIDDSSYPDTIVVNGPASGFNRDGIALTGTGSAGTPMAAAVQKVVTTNEATTYQSSATAHGQTEYNVLTASDPGVSVSNQEIHWTGNAKGIFATPIILLSHGEADPPNSIGTRWTTSTTKRV